MKQIDRQVWEGSLREECYRSLQVTAITHAATRRELPLHQMIIHSVFCEFGH